MKFNKLFTILPYNYYLFLHLFFYPNQAVFKSKDPKNCLKIFKSQIICLGLLVYIGLIIGIF